MMVIGASLRLFLTSWAADDLKDQVSFLKPLSRGNITVEGSKKALFTFFFLF